MSVPQSLAIPAADPAVSVHTQPISPPRPGRRGKQGKIYTRETSGRFNRLRWGMVIFTQLIFYGLCWLPWDGRQAVLFDLGDYKFHIFGLVLWPQDALYMVIVLVVAALALFWVTALAGRVFCGFACPQTVYTEMFMWIENRIEGDRVARMRRDSAPSTLAGLALKAAKHGAWWLLALWTGVTFVGYFTPVREVVAGAFQGQLGPWEWFWLFFYATFTYLQAGLLREKVCQHMCPYSRFQTAMFDDRTKVVAYDVARGEPRGALRSATNSGDCVDCSVCVQVCPTGIDIRQGLQYPCINCGLCIDGCDQIMDKLGRPRGLIRFAAESAGQPLAVTSGAATTARSTTISMPTTTAKGWRPRLWVYGALMVFFTGLGIYVLLHRVPLQVDVLRDRGALFREVEDGRVENAYRLHILNMDQIPHRFRVTVEGLPSARVVAGEVLDVAGGSTASLPVTVQAEAAAGRAGANPVQFTISSEEAADGRDQNLQVRENSVFMLP